MRRRSTASTRRRPASPTASEAAIGIQAAAELDVPPGMDLQSILREHRRFRAAHRLTRRGAEIKPPREGAVGAFNQDRPAPAGPVVLRVNEIDADFEQVQ